MKKADEYKVNVYEHGDYLVEIVRHKEALEAWLRHKDFGVSVFMFGTVEEYACFGTASGYEGFLDVVEKNLEFHIDLYAGDYLTDPDKRRAQWEE